MSSATPACTYVNGLKTVSATVAADSINPGENWSTFIVSFEMSITNSANLLDFSPLLMTRIYNPNNQYVYAKHAYTAMTALKVAVAARTDSIFGTTADSVARVAFGADPMSANGHLWGAGIYSEVYCVGSQDYNWGSVAAANMVTPSGASSVVDVASLPSNCM